MEILRIRKREREKERDKEKKDIDRKYFKKYVLTMQVDNWPMF